MSQTKEQQIIAMHLSCSPPENGVQFFSGFMRGLMDTRRASGRDPATGDKLPGVAHDSWVGCIGYLGLLDQIGTCFKPVGAPGSVNPRQSKILTALEYFTSLSFPEARALYALRCSFAHNFALYNVHSSADMQHRFSVTQNPTTPAVALPAIPWNGDYSNIQAGSDTVVNIVAIGDLVEDVCHKLFSLANSNDLELALPGGHEELLKTYMYMSRAV